jgi:flavin reductase (DIM6/NTAB) family NADH-FMN oxidoreductase RutF
LISVDVRDTFGEILGQIDYTMFIVTARAGRQLAGCLVGFACQTSINPPRFLVCLSRKNHTCQVAIASSTLAVHVVPPQAHALAELFGGCTGDEVDKFARCDWEPGPGGLPLLSECANWFVGTVLKRLDVGDHIGFLLEPLAAHRATGAPFFTFQQAKHIKPGHPA